MDAQDPLAKYRERFHLPRDSAGQLLRYFCGHSLGLQPRHARDYVLEEMDAWQRLGVEGHFAGERPWFLYHERLTPGLALLAGAQPSEVVAMNSLTVNLHLMLASFFRPTISRYKILIERSAFPSDRYAVVSQLQWHGLDIQNALIEIGPRPGEDTLRQEDIEDALARDGAQIAVVLLPGVQYLTGQCLDMAKITHTAQRHGCVVGFDLAHAIGNVSLALHDWNVDFAVWCSYKYLNGGPGAIGGCFVHDRHTRMDDLPRLAGWWGHDKYSRFAMPEQFKPIVGAEGWQISNPSILSAAPLVAALEIFVEADVAPLRTKSVQLTSLVAHLVRDRLRERVTIVTPLEQQSRGAQLSLRLHTDPRHAKSVHARLVAAGFICDWREPDILRIAPVPLYNTHQEVWQLVDTLLGILD
ncbi:MAG: kynureninase [Candidatus Obscuribacterales bacterium]|nr:kynureninase [Steroidobacteraceae bacterium]